VPSAEHVETALACIATIQKEPLIDHLFLDHDLGGETWVDSGREDCGMEVVRYLCSNDFTERIKHIVVHSHNVSAAQEMYLKLKDANYNVQLVPFSNLMRVIQFND
jgi:hypothetical protein